MRGAHDIALEVFTQDVGIAALRPSRHRLADPGKRLMAIQPTQLDHFAVQLETMIGELGVPETNHARVLIDHLIAAIQSDFYFVQIWLLQIPKLDPTERSEMDRVHHRFARNARSGN